LEAEFRVRHFSHISTLSFKIAEERRTSEEVKANNLIELYSTRPSTKPKNGKNEKNVNLESADKSEQNRGKNNTASFSTQLMLLGSNIGEREMSIDVSS
jgi:hypothetical protein